MFVFHKDPYDNNTNDFFVDKNLIKLIKNKLNNNENLFSKNVNSFLKDLEKDNVLNITVEPDEETCYLINNSNKYNNEKLKENIICYLIPTITCYDILSDQIEKEFNLEFMTALDLMDEVEKLYKLVINDFIEDMYYQIGGNIIETIQLGYSDFIGYVHNGYGDSGALYVNVINNNLNTQIDMC